MHPSLKKIKIKSDLEKLKIIPQNINYKFIIRQHPNSKIFKKEFNLKNGMFCPKNLSLEICLKACDILITFNSTVLFQAAMLGKKLITHSHSSPVFAPRFGLDLYNFKSQEEFLETIKFSKKPIKCPIWF